MRGRETKNNAKHKFRFSLGVGKISRREFSYAKNRRRGVINDNSNVRKRGGSGEINAKQSRNSPLTTTFREFFHATFPVFRGEFRRFVDELVVFEDSV